MSRGRLAVVALVIAVLVTGSIYALLQAQSRVEGAKRFLETPVEVSNEPVPVAEPPEPDPEVERLYNVAQLAFRAHDYAQAAADFEKTVEANPNGPLAGAAQWNLLRSRLRSGDGNGTVEAYFVLLRHYGDYLAAEAPALHEGLELMERGDMVGAEAAFRRMEEEQPESELLPLAHVHRARIYWQHGDAMATVRAFVDAFRSVRDDREVYGRLADLLESYADRKPDVADKFLQEAEVADEGFRDIYQYLGARTLLEASRPEDARRELEELRRRYPEGDFSHVVDLEQAWNYLREGEAKRALAIFLELEKRSTPERAGAFDEFFDIRPEYPLGVARSYLALGEYEKAIQNFERGMEEYPNSIYQVENEVGIATALEKLGRTEEAAEILNKVVAEHPDEPSVRNIRQQIGRLQSRRPTP